jgi:hypothetical protein
MAAGYDRFIANIKRAFLYLWALLVNAAPNGTCHDQFPLFYPRCSYASPLLRSYLTTAHARRCSEFPCATGTRHCRQFLIIDGSSISNHSYWRGSCDVVHLLPQKIRVLHNSFRRRARRFENFVLQHKIHAVGVRTYVLYFNPSSMDFFYSVHGHWHKQPTPDQKILEFRTSRPCSLYPYSSSPPPRTIQTRRPSTLSSGWAPAARKQSSRFTDVRSNHFRRFLSHGNSGCSLWMS